MNEQRPETIRNLDDIVCRGVAHDVFRAEQARLLLETLDQYVQPINETGVGKRFFAALQLILEQDLCLSVCRLYERYSDEYPGRTIPSALKFIAANRHVLPVADRNHLIQFLVSYGHGVQDLSSAPDEGLSNLLVAQCSAEWPRFERDPTRPLDVALGKLKTVRNKGIAHHERIDRASLVIPAWENIADLIGRGRDFRRPCSALLHQCAFRFAAGCQDGYALTAKAA